jgi:hypothetical protein
MALRASRHAVYERGGMILDSFKNRGLDREAAEVRKKMRECEIFD